VVLVATLLTTPAGTRNWLMERGPALAGMVALAVTYRRFPMSHQASVGVFVHALSLAYGGDSTCAKAPLGERLFETLKAR
jgi:putative membrane protein